jgi:signal transduction histidine kinase/ligand-binding sensor domain-containing protein/DNA-binding response OmpR family regulator
MTNNSDMRNLLKLILLFFNTYSFAGLQYTIDNGISNNNIECILQDSDGFLWIGTWNGLNRFDGYSFEHYFNGFPTRSIPNNWISKLFQDTQGTIWVGTISGLAYYDKRNNEFVTHPDITVHSISGITEDLNKHIWLSTSAGLYTINAETKQIVRFISIDQEPLFTNLEEIQISASGDIWLACRSGLLVLDASTSNIHRHIPMDWVKTIAFDTLGNIWCGTRTAGLTVLDTATLRHKTYIHEESNRNSLGSNSIWSVYFDTKQQLWIACQNGFLNKYDPDQSSFSKDHDTRINGHSNEFRPITAILEDRKGNLWLGYHRAGLYCISKQSESFEFYQSSYYSDHKVQFTNVTSFAQYQHNVLFGTDSDGLFVYNTKSKQISVYEAEQNNLSKNIITLYNHGNSIWAATWGDGIYEISAGTSGQISRYKHNKQDKYSIPINTVKGLLAVDTLLWVGTHGSGIALMDLKTKKLYHQINPLDKYDISYINPLWINHIYRDSKGIIWISTFYGIFSFSNGALHQYHYEADNVYSLSDNKVYSAFEDSDHTLWVVTGNALNLFDYATGRFSNASIELGLPASPRAITQDLSGIIWVSYEQGIMLYDPKTQNTIKYSNASMGTLGEFLHNSVYHSADGSIYFGTTEGFVRCYPGKLEQGDIDLSIHLRNMYVNYQLVHDTTGIGHISQLQTLRLPYSKDIISIEIACLDLSQLYEISYSYELRGYDHAKITIDNNRQISFSGLDPGRYALAIKAEVNGMLVATKELEIIIVPKWWMTWWFKAIAALLLVAIVSLYIYMRGVKQRKINIILHRKIQERTSELNQQKQILEQQYTIITKKNEELQIANDTKLKLFSIISHDLKNPLNAVLGLSHLLIERFASYSEIEKLKILHSIENSTNILVDMTVNLLDWSVIQTNSIEPSIGLYDLSLIIQETIQQEKEIANAKQVAIRTQLAHRHSVLADKTMLATVIRNILHNSIKFTPQNGNIVIATSELSDFIVIEIKDNGVGMSAFQIEAIMHSSNTPRSTYGTNNEKGTGLGLSIAKEFISKNNGTLNISSDNKTGSSFVINIPKGSALEQQACEQDCCSDETATRLNTIEKDDDVVVCIVEDNPSILMLINSVLSPYYTTHTATDGEKGYSITLSQIPDIIITDIEMPQMNGLEMIRKLRKHPLTNHIPILILSSKDSDMSQIEGYQSGADDYITKPFNQEILANKVQAVLAQRKRYLKHFKMQSYTQHIDAIPESMDEKFAKSATDYIENNYSKETLSVEDLAAHMNISRVQLFRKFKSIIGTNPQDFIKNYRLEKAGMLLKTKKWRVSDVAYQVGFSEPHYFSSCFAKHYGISPSKYMEAQD